MSVPKEDSGSNTPSLGDWEPSKRPSIQASYKPLHGESIRLLRLLPGKDDENIRCEPIATALNPIAPDEAIRYAWDGSGRKDFSLGEPKQSVIYLNRMGIDRTQSVPIPTQHRPAQFNQNLVGRCPAYQSV